MFSLLKHVQAIKPALNLRISASIQSSALDQAKYAQLEEKLGLPPRPKRPLSPYFRFLQDNRPQIAKENPKLKATEVVKLCAQKYRDDIDDATKLRYRKEYAKEQEDYARKRFEHEEKLTMEQKLTLADAKNEAIGEIEERNKRVAYKKKLRDNNKPKRPVNGFIKFFLEYSRKNPRDPSTSFRDWQRAGGEKWKALSDAQKQVYRDVPKAEFDKYKEDLINWEHKMVRLGNTDIVRDATAIDPNPDKPRRSRAKKHAASTSDSD